jgi:hypothetical protein
LVVRSFILYTEVEIEDNAVDCVYLFKDGCHAQPFLDKETGYYKPEDDDRKTFCTNRYHVRECPRLQSYEVYVKALGLEGIANRLKGQP